MTTEQADQVVSLLEEFESYLKKVKAAGPYLAGIIDFDEDKPAEFDCPEPQRARLIELKSSITDLINNMEQ